MSPPDRIKSIPVPKRMKGLERDHRGYPIPVMVFRDKTGKPHFTINNEASRIVDIIYGDCCSICGGKLLPERWFAGGSMSAFHPNGAYNDPPMHRDCLHYAMKVCPYLALPSYTTPIDGRTLRDPDPHRIMVDNTITPGRPAGDLFVAVCSIGTRINVTGSGPLDPIYVHPNRPYKRLEFWRHGKQLSNTEAMAILRPIFETAEMMENV